jgi:hypothetical protein
VDFLYRSLGVMASVAHSGSRHRVNYVPQSFIPLIGWLFLPFFVLGGLMSLGQPKGPQPISAAEIVKAREAAGYEFVTLSGRYDPAFALASAAADDDQEVNGSTGELEGKVYVAFIDPQAHAAVMVQMPPSMAEGLTEAPTTVTGMLRYGEPPLRKQLPERLRGLPLSHYVYLEAGAIPPSLGSYGLVAGVLLIPLSLYTYAFGKRGVIFRRERRLDAAAPPPVAEPLREVADVRATGRFILDEQLQERFVQVPTSVNGTADGSLALHANVDASCTHSLYFIPLSKERRVGYWLLWLGNQTIRDVELGTQYLGWTARPAIRCKYRHPQARAIETAVLSFDSDATRSAMLAELLRRQGNS